MSARALFPEREIDAKKLARTFARMHSDPSLEPEVASDIEQIKRTHDDLLCVVPFMAGDHTLSYEVGFRGGGGRIMQAGSVAA